MTLHRPNDLVTPVATLSNSKGRQFQERLNETGSGRVTLMNDDAALALVQDNDVLVFRIDGSPVFSALVRERDQRTIDTGEEAAQVTQLSGPGGLAILDTALVYPSRGLGSKPIEEDRVFNWAAPDYDDSGWGTALAIVQQSGMSLYWTGFPDKWPAAVGNAWWIWAHVANPEEWAPDGPCYFRRSFTVPAGATRLLYWVTFDATGELYLDGQKLASGDYGIEPNVNVYSEMVDITPGNHSFAAVCVNDIDPENDQVHNPGGLLVAAYAVDAMGNWLSQVVVSDDTWKIVEYPAAPPAITVGTVIRQVVEEAIGRGWFVSPALDFTDTEDSEGVAWPQIPGVSTKVGTDLLAFVRELTATYCDVSMTATGWTLRAWLPDGRGTTKATALHAPTDPTDPTTGNLRALSHKVAQ